MTIGYGGIPRRRQGRLQRRLSSRHRQLIAHAPVGRMASHAGARQRLNPSRRLRRGDLEQIRIDNGPFSPPGVLDEPGLLEPIEPARGRQRGRRERAVLIGELASAGSHASGGKVGCFNVKAYFDDAGTYNGSPIALVMGGLIRTVAQWERLEDRWGKQLADPLPEAGKPRLQMFHMAECEASQGEFRDYKLAEWMLVAQYFRRHIAECGAVYTSSSVDVAAWDGLIIGPNKRRPWLRC